MLAKIDQQRILNSDDYGDIRRLVGNVYFKFLVRDFPLETKADFDHFFGEYGVFNLTLSGLLAAAVSAARDRQQQVNRWLGVAAANISKESLEGVVDPAITVAAAQDLATAISSPTTEFYQEVFATRSNLGLELDIEDQPEIFASIKTLHELMFNTQTRDLLYDQAFVEEHRDQLLTDDTGEVLFVDPDDPLDGDEIHWCAIRPVGALQRQVELSAGNSYSRSSPPSVAIVAEMQSMLQRVFKQAQLYQALRRFRQLTDGLLSQYMVTARIFVFELPPQLKVCQQRLNRILNSGLPSITSHEKIGAAIAVVKGAFNDDISDMHVSLVLQDLLSTLREEAKAASMSLDKLSVDTDSILGKIENAPLEAVVRQYHQRKALPIVQAAVLGHWTRQKKLKRPRIQIMSEYLSKHENDALNENQRISLLLLSVMTEADVPDRVCDYPLVRHLMNIDPEFLDSDYFAILRHTGLNKVTESRIDALNKLAKQLTDHSSMYNKIMLSIPAAMITDRLIYRLAKLPADTLCNGYFRQALQRLMKALYRRGFTAITIDYLDGSWFASEGALRSLITQSDERLVMLASTGKPYQIACAVSRLGLYRSPLRSSFPLPSGARHNEVCINPLNKR